MTNLARVAIVLGSVIAMIHAPCVVAPNSTRKWIRLFPRSKRSAWLLVAGDLVWVGWLVFNTPLGRFEDLKPLLYVLVPATLFLVINLMDELLAARALGGLLLLVPWPMLTAARWHESDLRFVVTVLAYLFAVAGIILVLSPYWFRKTMAFWIRNDSLCRIWGIFGLGVGIFIIFLGIAVY